MKELYSKIGKKYSLYYDGLVINVIIDDIRKVWGRVDAKIRPISGSGEKWVNIESLKEI